MITDETCTECEREDFLNLDFPQNEEMSFEEFWLSAKRGIVLLRFSGFLILRKCVLEEKCLSAKRGKATVELGELLILRKDYFIK